MISDATRCPCGTGLTYGECCAVFHRGKPAPTAEALMRSRYSAFVVHDADYLLRTWSQDTRPTELGFDDNITFYRLDVLATTGGGPLDSTGTVDFEAHYRVGKQRGSQREHSRFTRDGGNWIYVEEG
ncbi:SEC-C domain-containing protein [Corynebacterium hindlerae]|uniref:SEC-C domain-containing protein n=1 Tax=Corynebacterium hindlerae TaxID=699041 RepID=A0A7G5FF56_9CORY|nr:YchJ family metal-binding protein [Corynebacterium hindlerae]QMV85247.1 SEC-C domain-containing protein [Corynebacterium hindlerae]QTH58872.1 SEC-C domain-containing protein [Corynebacterium hindlerae]